MRRRSAFAGSMTTERACFFGPSPKANVFVLPTHGVRSMSGSPKRDTGLPSLSSTHTQSLGGGQLGGRNEAKLGVICGRSRPKPNKLKSMFVLSISDPFRAFNEVAPVKMEIPLGELFQGFVDPFQALGIRVLEPFQLLGQDLQHHFHIGGAVGLSVLLRSETAQQERIQEAHARHRPDVILAID